MADQIQINPLALPPKQQQLGLSVSVVPSECPICHYSIIPVIPGYSAFCMDDHAHESLSDLAKELPSELKIDLGDKQVIEVLFRCPRKQCGRPFFGQYIKIKNSGYYLKKCMPKTAKGETFDPKICSLSPAFVEIYNQALEAEVLNLDEVSGVAFRKSLEFLIKDYCISRHPKKAEKIKKKFLGSCISDDISDPNVKMCAEKATWLGNDETHYIRRWEDKDINDLKTLIKLTVNWIMNEAMTEEYMKSFNNGNQQQETK